MALKAHVLHYDHVIDLKQITPLRGVRRRSDGTIRTLHQAAWEHYSAEWATVKTSAKRRSELIGDYAAARANAIALHARLGFRVVGTFEGIGWKHGRWLDGMQMQRALGDGASSEPTG